MKRKAIRISNFIIVLTLLMAMTLQAAATTIQDIEADIEADQNALEGINDELVGLQDEQDLLEEEISDLDAELLNTMAEIGVLEEEIAAKEADIQAKTDDIAVTEKEYEKAKEEEEAQYAAMVVHIQQMYERGETDIFEILFTAESFSDILSHASYIEAVYAYDQKMLTEYENARIQVKELWDTLEAEKVDLESQMASLESDKRLMEDQTVYLNGLLDRKRQESANFEAQIARAAQEAKALETKIKQEKAELKKLQAAQQAAQQRNNAASGSYTVTPSVSTIIDGASGSDLGKQIARYGCQFIGNPYVMGGTSLTNGADCSGFIYRIYADFGYTVPRTSYQQRSAGTEVSYENAQPGDIICYEGHVGLYIGNGYIVHASSQKTGIKISRATYRTILSVRRII